MDCINFTKMHGLGNDFIIFDSSQFSKVDNKLEFIKRICKRNFSIGADGVIVVGNKVINADISWEFYNSDGTVAQMCGNGIRCFAKYVYDNGILGEDVKCFSVLTQAGIIKPEIIDNSTIRVNMGKPILTPSLIPFKGNRNLNIEIELWSKKFIINAISMGNPHCVIFVNEDDNTKILAKDYGPDIEIFELFPQKTNVEFVKVLSKSEIIVDVWERSCGITLACGTGACASVVAGILNGLLNNKVKVHLPGGDLDICWDGNIENPNFDVFMTGEANYSFWGSVSL